MRPSLDRLWDRTAPIIVAIAVFIGVCGGAYGIYQQHVSTDRGATNQQILKEIVQTDKTLAAGAKRRTAEIASLQRSNDIGAVILKDAALEEEYLSEQEHNICVVTPGCVLVQYPTLLPIPPSIPLPDP